MLDVEETNNLISLAKEGDNDAKEKLVKENSPLIKSVIKKVFFCFNSKPYFQENKKMVAF